MPNLRTNTKYKQLKNTFPGSSVEIQNEYETHLLPMDSGSLFNSKKQVLIVEVWNASPHLETGLEIALRLASKGCKIVYMHIGEYLPCVEYFNAFGGSLKEKLLGYKASQNKGIAILKGACAKLKLNVRIAKPSSITYKCEACLPISALQSFQSLSEYSPRDSPKLGISVASSLASLLGSSLITPSEHSELCNNLAASYMRSHAITSEAIKKYKPEALIVFNGRFACVKGIAIAAVQSGVDVFYHERGSSKDRFTLYPFQPHDRIALQKHILNQWYQLKTWDQAKSIASAYYEDKANGNGRDWTSFVVLQKPGCAQQLLKESRLTSKTGKVITFFTSSEDEFLACADAWQPDQLEWTNQIEAITNLIGVALTQGHGIAVRVHPHLLHKDKREREMWDTLSFLPPALKCKVAIIVSDSPVSSYELIRFSDVVASYGSTVGVEAVYWQKPSILLGNSGYDRCCECIYQPSSTRELENILMTIDQLKVCRESAYPYGFHGGLNGVEFKFYKADTLFSGKFFGINLQDSEHSLPHRVLSKIKRTLMTLLP